ncbi:MAG: addiction module protein [Verrucomicrobiae bacterium]|nr:addiction module protein [Verrucomicrobiae bacterium]
MTVIEQLHQLPLREKILAMEAIWDDLSRDEANLEVPQWHKDLLDERERAIADGTARFVDWEDAKKRIRQSLR